LLTGASPDKGFAGGQLGKKRPAEAGLANGYVSPWFIGRLRAQ
jgi:hypothetical protein